MLHHPRFGEIVRTPDDRFDHLPGYDFAPRWIEDLARYEGLRAHYLDEGPRDGGRVFLCLHGEPSWSYLYRKMIPHFVASGARVVAPDFFGFGKSDKPVDDAVYTTDFHRNALIGLIERLDLTNITLVVQDWGGLLGLTLPLHMPQRIARLIIMNTAFSVGGAPSPGFLAWREYAKNTPDMAVGGLFERGTPNLRAAEIAAYDAPFPDHRFKAGVRRFPQLVSVDRSEPFAVMSQKARDWWRHEWQGESFAAIGMADPVLGPAVMAEVLSHIRNCPKPLEIAEGGHFVQEWGDVIAPAALKAFGDV
jgi:pimeloyl-ACP methyl ester carboxylesterase